MQEDPPSSQPSQQIPLSVIVLKGAKLSSFLLTSSICLLVAAGFYSSQVEKYWVGCLIALTLLAWSYFSCFNIANVYYADHKILLSSLGKKDVRKEVAQLVDVRFRLLCYTLYFKDSSRFNFTMKAKTEWIQASQGLSLKESFVQNIKEYTR